jgi:hypothetical protein
MQRNAQDERAYQVKLVQDAIDALIEVQYVVGYNRRESGALKAAIEDLQDMRIDARGDRVADVAGATITRGAGWAPMPKR